MLCARPANSNRGGARAKRSRDCIAGYIRIWRSTLYPPYSDPIQRVSETSASDLVSGWQNRSILMPLFGIPLAEMKINEALRVMRDANAVMDLSTRVSTQIPDQSEGCLSLLDTYERSDLAAFHRTFYSEQAAPRIPSANVRQSRTAPCHPVPVAFSTTRTTGC